MANTRWMALGSRGQIFHAVIDHLDRMPALHGQQSRMSSEDGRIIFFAAEGSAGLCLNHSYLIFGHIKNRKQRFVHIKGALQRTPHSIPGLHSPISDDAVVIDIEMLLSSGAVFAFDDMRGTFPDLIDIAFFKQETF